MKIMAVLACLMVLVAAASRSSASLDLEKDVLVIPNTHQDKEYRWKVEKNPKDVEAVLTYGNATDAEIPFTLVIRGVESIPADKVHVFIVDRDLQHYRHLRPKGSGDNTYSFDFSPPKSARYRFEIVFMTLKGWVNVSQDLRLPSVKGVKTAQEGDEHYDVAVKRSPRIFYADHVSTLIYDLTYKGSPVRDLEKMDGADIQFASWDEDLKDFVYATSTQNTGGPEVPVSVVFTKPGEHAVFAEFKHGGVMRKIESAVTVFEEPKENPSAGH